METTYFMRVFNPNLIQIKNHARKTSVSCAFGHAGKPGLNIHAPLISNVLVQRCCGRTEGKCSECGCEAGGGRTGAPDHARLPGNSPGIDLPDHAFCGRRLAYIQHALCLDAQVTHAFSDCAARRVPVLVSQQSKKGVACRQETVQGRPGTGQIQRLQRVFGIGQSLVTG